jgi:hypothetical protein
MKDMTRPQRTDYDNILLTDVMAQLARLTNQIEELRKIIIETGIGGSTIKQFCARYSLSTRQFHTLRSQGRGPVMMSIGSDGLRISKQAELDWVKAREAETMAKKESY